MTQGSLFPAPLGCLHGQPIGVSCNECFALLELGCAAFDLDVDAGIYDAFGYTPAERRAQTKRKGA